MKKLAGLAAAAVMAATLAACTGGTTPAPPSTTAQSPEAPNLNNTVMNLNQSPVDGLATPAPTPPGDLANRYNWLHLKWNARAVNEVTALFASKISYTDHASGIVYTTPDEWAKAQGGIFSAASNVKLSNRVYWQDAKAFHFEAVGQPLPQAPDEGTRLTISKFTLSGTNDRPYQGHPATGRRFLVDGAEILRWDKDGKVVGGDLYYDRLGVLFQLGDTPPSPSAPATSAQATAAPATSASTLPPGLSTTIPPSIVERASWGHDWWNARDLRPFLPLFDRIFYYVDRPTHIIISTVPEMNSFASAFWGITSDAQMVNRTYYQVGNSVLATFTINGTNDRMPDGKPPTNKKFSLDGAEFIFFSSEGTGVGGDMYFDRADFLQQLGFLPPSFGP